MAVSTRDHGGVDRCERNLEVLHDRRLVGPGALRWDVTADPDAFLRVVNDDPHDADVAGAQGHGRSRETLAGDHGSIGGAGERGPGAWRGDRDGAMPPGKLEAVGPGRVERVRRVLRVRPEGRVGGPQHAAAAQVGQHPDVDVKAVSVLLVAPRVPAVDREAVQRVPRGKGGRPEEMDPVQDTAIETRDRVEPDHRPSIRRRRGDTLRRLRVDPVELAFFSTGPPTDGGNRKAQMPMPRKSKRLPPRATSARPLERDPRVEYGIELVTHQDLMSCGRRSHLCQIHVGSTAPHRTTRNRR